MSIKNLFEQFIYKHLLNFANLHAAINKPANLCKRTLKIDRFDQTIYVTIIFVTLLVAGCRAVNSYDTSLDYLGQTPASAFAQENISPITSNPPTVTTNTAVPNSTSFPTQPIPSTSETPESKFIDVPFSDPFGTSASVLPAQNQPSNPPTTPNILSNTSPQSYSNWVENKTDQGIIKPQNNTVTPPQTQPLANPNQNIRNENSTLASTVPAFSSGNPPNNIVVADTSGIWGDTNATTQSINEAAKNENENFEKNRLLEIARAKRQQDIDPQKKHLQPLSARLGPFADRDKREVIDNDINIISPVNYLEENPKIFDNKPIYDWEKEEHAAFDWSKLDPVNLSTNIIDKLGFGPTEEKVRQHMQNGRDILLKAKQKSDEIAESQKLSDNGGQDKLPKNKLTEQEKLYRNAGAEFYKAAKGAKKLSDSVLEEDALNLAGESYFFGGDYTRAFNAYQSLMIRYKHSKHIDLTTRRLFAIARYWESVDRQNKITLVNFTEKSLPYVDTFGYAGKAYETIFINDPNNPLADDAVMALASAHLARGKYEGDTSYERAAFYYKYLTENYPLSEHFDKARKGELFARSEAYMGAEYNHKTLNAAQELAEMINRSQTPNQTEDNEADAITELNENIVMKNAEREWVVGQYYDTKRYYGSARLFYQKLIEKYPQTSYAEQARKRLEQIKNKPDKPSTFSFFQKSNTK
ncbi:MAG: hypothetical protein LBH59_09805 [Planctomycetaceae bacterium]|jgi:hypothetical protein|nr:hypothetical protein [Planctomycetaceae bacterium]